MDNNVIWKKNELRFFERYTFLLGLILTLIPCVLYLLLFSYDNVIFLYATPIFGLLITFFLIGTFYVVLSKYCLYPEMVGITKNKLYFKQGKKQYTLNSNNIEKVRIVSRKVLEIKLIKPNIVCGYKLTPVIIEQIENNYKNYFPQK